MDERLCRRVTDLGPPSRCVPPHRPRVEFQTVRLARLAAVPALLWPRQYDNPLNPASYAVVAEHLPGRLGRIDALIGPVGRQIQVRHRGRQLPSQPTAAHCGPCEAQGAVVWSRMRPRRSPKAK